MKLRKSKTKLLTERIMPWEVSKEEWHELWAQGRLGPGLYLKGSTGHREDMR